jgi:hypothetical protein
VDIKMDDFSLSSLQESRNEYCSRLITLLTPCIIDGVKSIFDESWKLCIENDEKPKYLMTFQNFLTRVPKWNPNIISQECARIKEKSNCSYIPDLITCVHINQLKMLSCMRVGTKQKKVNINVPNLEDFIHKVYINAARKIYTNVYLFENGITQLKLQRNARDLEVLIRECVVQTIRENIPVEELLKLYMTETIEDAIEVHEKDEIISQEPIIQDQSGGNSGSGIGAAGSMTNPSFEESEKISKEEKDKLEMIKAANDHGDGNTNGNVSFNMDNNQVIPIPPNENKNSSREDNYDDDDYDIDNEDDDDDDGYAENVKLKIGGNVELSVDPFPADSDNSSGLGTDDGNGDSDVELTIDEIPMIDGY